MYRKIIKLILRLSISASFLSAVLDRFGYWPEKFSVWGNWNAFVDFTALINPWFGSGMVSILAVVATILEILLALTLLLGFKTEFSAKLSGFLLLAFGLSMTFSLGIKSAFDYSVFTAMGAAFALSLLKDKHWELDNLFKSSK